MGIYRHFPYSNFHEMNMDELIKIFLDMQDKWNETKEEWATYKDYIDNYFNTLDLSEETYNAILRMIENGVFNETVDPVIINEVENWLNENINNGYVVDKTLSISGAAADAKITGDNFKLKVNIPLDEYNQPDNGTEGQVLRTKGNGKTEWVNVGLPTDEQTAQAINEWLDNHPEATTTVLDGSLTEAKFSNALKIKTIKEYVTPQMFGAKGDGITDDTQALQDCLSSMANGSLMYLPKGTYLTTQIICNDIENARYIFDGTLKLKENMQTPYGVFVAKGVNCIFDGIKIDGNADNVIDEGAYGISCLLLVDSNTKHCNFNNIYLENSKYSACIFNSNIDNVTFNSCIMESIGEHCYYIGGSGVTQIRFNNIYVKNIGINSNNITNSHDCHVIKIKLSDFSDLYANNIILDQSVDPTITVCIINTNGNNINLTRGILSGYAVALVLIDNDAKNVTIKDSVSTHSGIWGVNINKDSANIKMINCRIANMQYADYVISYDACTFNRISSRTQSLNNKLSPTFFNKCQFISKGTTKPIAFDCINCDIFITDSIFIDESSASVSGYAIYFGADSAVSDAMVWIKGSKLENKNYSLFIGLQNTTLSVLIDESIIAGYCTFKLSHLFMHEIIWNDAYQLSNDGRNNVANLETRNIWKNWVVYNIGS